MKWLGVHMYSSENYLVLLFVLDEKMLIFNKVILYKRPGHCKPCGDTVTY